MPTVIDSLVVTLGLDPSQFTKGQKEAFDSFKKTQEEAVKGSKEIEYQAGRTGDALGGIRTQALELFAVFTGGKGLLEFAAHTIATNSQLGRLSRNLGISVEMLSKWQGAARIFGGDGAQMAQTFTTISDAVAGFKIGVISPLIADFRALSTAGGTIIDVNKGVDQTLLDISANLAKVNAADPARAGLLGRMIGLDPGLYDLLVKGPMATKEMLDKVNALGPATKAATDAAGDLERRWNSIGVKADAVGRKILNSGFGGTVAALADELNKPISESRPWDALFGTGAYATGAQASAPAAAQGGGVGSRGDRNNNPGNMKDGAFARSHGATGNDGAFAVFPDWSTGSAAQEALVRGSSYQGLTLDQFAQKYAEGSSAWRATVGGALGIGGSDIVNNQDPRLIGAIRRAEGTGMHGWGAYHGAANSGIGAWAGIDRGPGGSTTSTKIDVNGPITINAGPNADGAAIAGKFTQTMKNQGFAAQANDGQN